MTPISIIIPCFNYGAYIGETLAAVDREVGDEDEVIIVDDGSTDGTGEMVSKWIGNKACFRYIYQENSGPAAARNRGLDEAQNPYAYLLDSDDRPLPGKLNILKQAAERSPEAAMVIGGHLTYDPSGKEKTHPAGKLSENRKANFVAYAIEKSFGIANGGCVLVKTEIARRYRYPVGIRLSDDICLYSWILGNHSCQTVDDIIVAIRKHEDSLRNQVAVYEDSIRRLPDILFDPQRLPADLLNYREEFEQHLKLSLFRAQFKAGQTAKARSTYLEAIKTKPSALFQWTYFSKFLRTLF